MTQRRGVLSMFVFAAASSVCAATLQDLTHQPPAPVGLPFLLTDGSVMFQGENTPSIWFKLTPDATGSYLNGTWTALAGFPASWNYQPFAFASAVLADGAPIPFP